MASLVGSRVERKEDKNYIQNSKKNIFDDD